MSLRIWALYLLMFYSGDYNLGNKFYHLLKLLTIISLVFIHGILIAKSNERLLAFYFVIFLFIPLFAQTVLCLVFLYLPLFRNRPRIGHSELPFWELQLIEYPSDYIA